MTKCVDLKLFLFLLVLTTGKYNKIIIKTNEANI